MKIKNKIYKILSEYYSNENDCYLYEKDSIYLKDKIENMLKKENIQFQINIIEIYDNPAIIIYNLNIAYIEDSNIKLISEPVYIL